MADRDQYGGWTGKRFEAMGFFRTERDGERWWLVTPKGNAFLSLGINHYHAHCWAQDYNREHWVREFGAAEAGDHQSSFYTDAYPKTMWPQLPDEAAAAEAYARYLPDAFARPYLIGYHRCQYIDRFETRLGILKQGLLREDQSPYELLVDRVRRTNLTVLRNLGIGRET